MVLPACAQTLDGPAFLPVSALETGPSARDGGSDTGDEAGPDAREADATMGGADATTDAASDATADATRPLQDAGADTIEGSAPDATPADAANDTRDPVADAGCPTAVIALVAGNASTAVASTWTNGAWAPATSLAGSVKARPSVVPTASGFAAASIASDDALVHTTFASGAWAQLAAVGVGLAALDEPRLVVVDGSVRLVFQRKGGSDNTRYFDSAWSGTAWQAPELVGGGSDISFGPRAPWATTSGSSLAITHAGGNGALYRRERAAAWGASTAIGTVATRNDLPVASTELSVGSEIVVYSAGTGQSQRLKYVTRTATAWSAEANVYDDGANRAYSSDPLSLIRLPDGRALLVFRGANTNLYASLYDPTPIAKWSAPASITAQLITASSPPALTAGVCGADAIAAFAEGGSVKLTRFAGTTWSVPETVPAITAMTFVGVASKP